jgi:hypothetical protein
MNTCVRIIYIPLTVQPKQDLLLFSRVLTKNNEFLFIKTFFVWVCFLQFIWPETFSRSKLNYYLDRICRYLGGQVDLIIILIIKERKQWTIHQPETVVENDEIKISWDFNIFTDRKIPA